MNLDQQIFLQLNSMAASHGFLGYIAMFFAEYSEYVLGFILLIFLFFPTKEKLLNRVMVFVSLMAAAIARLVVKTLILLLVHRPPPFLVLPAAQKLLATYAYENYQSFPSGHAIFFFALAMGLFLFNKKIGLWYFLAAVVMGVARVACGIHWPTDIVGGAILGMFT